MSPLPQLIQTHQNGGTIHKYELSGGKKQFMRFIGCFDGSCKFFNDVEEATRYLETNV